MSARMRCRPCGKTYRVADAHRSYRCKSCGEPLLPVQDGARGEDDAAAERARQAEVKRANAELLRWRKAHGGLKAYYVYAPGVILAGSALVMAYAAWQLDRPITAWFLASVVAVVVVATRFLGRLADARPIIATTIFAGISTVLVAPLALTALRGELHPARLAVPVAFCAATWNGVRQARRAERIRRELPEAYRRKEGLERAQLRSESVSERHAEAARDTLRRQIGRKAVIGGAVGGAVLLAAGIEWSLSRPPAPDSTVQAFLEAWEAGDIDAAVALGTSSDTIDRGLRVIWKRKGWSEDPPDLAGWHVLDRDGDRLRVRYELEDGRSSAAHWSLRRGRWVLSAFAAPK